MIIPLVVTAWARERHFHFKNVPHLLAWRGSVQCCCTCACSPNSVLVCLRGLRNWHSLYLCSHFLCFVIETVCPAPSSFYAHLPTWQQLPLLIPGTAHWSHCNNLVLSSLQCLVQKGFLSLCTADPKPGKQTLLFKDVKSSHDGYQPFRLGCSSGYPFVHWRKSILPSRSSGQFDCAFNAEPLICKLPKRIN